MASRVITVNRDTKPGVLPILYGMGLVFSNMIRTIFGKSLVTISYPEVKRPTSTRYRGIHVLTQREDGTYLVVSPEGRFEVTHQGLVPAAEKGFAADLKGASLQDVTSDVTRALAEAPEQ